MSSAAKILVESLQILPATPVEAEDIEALERACFPSPWRREFFDSEIVAEGRYNRVVKDGRGQLIGYLFAMYYLDEMHVNKIAVRVPQRRQGIATALMKHCTDFARSRGIRAISLEVRQSNRGAQDFYRRLGFKPLYIRPSYYPDGEAAVVMSAQI